MSSDAIPLTRIKLIRVPLYLYEQVILTKNGSLFLGNVVSHLPIEDWVVMKGYTLSHFIGRRYATAGEVTRLTERVLRGAAPDSKRTIMGMSPVRGSVPPPSSRRQTVIGVALPSASHLPAIRPTPIKIIE